MIDVTTSAVASVPASNMPSGYTGRLHVRDPKQTTLTEVEKTVFGNDAKLHPVTMMVLQQGSGANGPDQQARDHVRTMIGQLQRLCEQYRAEGDATKKERMRADHMVTAERVATVVEQLIDQTVLDKSVLTKIPQL